MTDEQHKERAGRTNDPAPDSFSASGGSDLGDSDELISRDAAELRSQLEEAKERALRLQAEWENYRKRARRELDEERRYADLQLLTDLLPVLDNMQRAIDAAAVSSEGGGLLEGFKLVKQQLDNLLSQHNCKRIEALNQPFDPHLHEAVMQQPSADHPPHTVLNVVREGYTLHDRVLRPAQVIVAAGD